MKIIFTCILLFFSCLILNSCAPVSQRQYEKNGLTPLTAPELKNELQGKHIRLEAIDFNGVVLFKEDGTLSATNHKNYPETGKWSLLKDDLVCIEFKSWYYGDKRCYRIIKTDDNLIFFSANGALHYTAKIAAGTTNPTISVSREAIEMSQAPGLTLEINGSQSLDNAPDTDKDRFVRLAKNCPGCNLRGVDLSNGQLNYANLAGADLRDADLTGANLRRANLEGADLAGAKLIGTDLVGARLSSADLSNADCSGCNLSRANLLNTTFNNTDLTGAHLDSIQGTSK